MDIAIHDNGSGGDFNLVDNYDIELTDGLFNQPYLAHFGGNVEASTTGEEEEGQERFDWWGNGFLSREEQFNSGGERALNIYALNGDGRSKIEEDFNADLAFFSVIGTSETEAIITGNDRIQINEVLFEPEKQTENRFKFLWDATKEELIQDIII